MPLCHPFPTALGGFALVFDPQDPTHHPPPGLSWNWIKLGPSNHCQRLNSWNLYFFTFKLGAHCTELPRGQPWATAHAQPT